MCRAPHLSAALSSASDALPQPNAALPLLSSKTLIHPSSIKPINPDSPDTKSGHMLLPMTHVGDTNGLPGYYTPSQMASHTHRSPSDSPTNSSHSRGVSGFELPPIPMAHAASTPCGQKCKAVNADALPVLQTADKVGNVSRTARKQSAKTKGNRSVSSTAAATRHKQVPGWNSDFAVRYDDPVSIKNQELALKRKTQVSVKQTSPARGHASQQQQPAARPARALAAQPGQLGHHAGAGQKCKAWATCSSQTKRPAHVCLAEPGCPDGDRSCQPCWHAAACDKSWGPSERSSDYNRNLDSAQSPIRPLKGKMGGSFGVAELDKLHCEGPQVWLKFLAQYSLSQEASDP